MPADLADLRLRDTSRFPSKLLSAIEHPVVGVLGLVTVVSIVALLGPLPTFPVAVYAPLCVAEGFGLALVAENVLHRPVRRFRRRMAVRNVGTVAGAVLTFVVAMALLGLGLTLRDWALLSGFACRFPRRCRLSIT